MNEGPSLFDAARGEHAKHRGMQVAANNRAELLLLARRLATSIARREGSCTADDVGKAMEAGGSEGGTSALGPAAGSIFAGKDWHFTGQRIKSAKTCNHSRELKVWTLREGD